METIKRNSFFLLAILIVLGAYLFLRYDKAVAPTDDPQQVAQNPSSEEAFSADRLLTDEDLANYAQTDFDQAKMMGQELILGKHDDTLVKVTFPCSDVCPQSTLRIIRYDVPNEQCQAAGGELKSILVPMAITVMKQEFCFPKPIVQSGVYEFIEN